MKLRTWLVKERLTHREFGAMLEPPVSIGAVNKWAQGHRTPPIKRVADIVRVTGGEVSFADFAPDHTQR